ncbi:MAG: hypothetical protein QXP98_04735 [Thermoproteus sp.]
MSLAGALLAKTERSLLDRCALIKRGVIVYRNYATDVCITEDGEYVVADPPIPDLLEKALALTALRGAVPPDYDEYDKAMRDSLSALMPGRGVRGWRWYRGALRTYREHRELIHYFLDRWTGHGEFGGYGALEALLRDELLTEVTIPQPLAPQGRWKRREVERTRSPFAPRPRRLREPESPGRRVAPWGAHAWDVIARQPGARPGGQTTDVS